MTDPNAVDILLVEDNPTDVELTMRALKKHNLANRIFVVLTSSREEQDIVESYKLGVNSYIVKPLDFDKFVESVSRVGLYWLLLNQLPL